MERKIGEIFEIGGEWYQCVKSDDTCNGCIGKFQPYSFCHGFEKCAGKIFKKLEKVGEPYPYYCPSGRIIYFQRYKIFSKLNSHNTECVMCDFSEDGIVSIEIKQNKEDMEEKNLKPFDLEAAKAGKNVCTRDGRKARIICFDRENEQPIVALIKDDEDEMEYIDTFFNNGHSVSKTNEVAGDLMMLPEKKEGWVNVYKERVYGTKEEAIKAKYDGATYVDTVNISWEE